MGRFKINKLLAAVLGVLVGVGPVLWATSWLPAPSNASSARWMLGTVEAHIDRAVAALDALADRGVTGCASEDIELMRVAVLTAGPVKEIAVVGAHSEILCTDRGEAGVAHELVSSTPTAEAAVTLDVVQPVASASRMLRVRHQSSPDRVALAALLPAELLLPQIMPGGERFVGAARVVLLDGTLIAAADAPLDPAAGKSIGLPSERYGLLVGVEHGPAGASVWYGVSLIASGLLSLILLVAALIIPWRERRDPVTAIERAIAAGEFVPYYQPIIDITSGRLAGAEVLVRWRKRDGSLVSPALFIPFLESTELVLDMTRSLMHQVCDEAGPLLEQRPNLYVAFNIAPRHLDGDTLIDDIGSIFVGGPIRMSQIVLEITERYEIKNLTSTRKLIAELQGLGCRIAIDDVGTGHNGLSYILKLGVDIIKIDKIFVDAIRTEAHSQAVVDTLVDLARNLKMQIVAEGVEDFEQVAFLRDRGISSAQGFVFAPPLPGPSFFRLIEAIDPLVASAPAAIDAHSRPAAA